MSVAIWAGVVCWDGGCIVELWYWVNRQIAWGQFIGPKMFHVAGLILSSEKGNIIVHKEDLFNSAEQRESYIHSHWYKHAIGIISAINSDFWYAVNSVTFCLLFNLVLSYFGSVETMAEVTKMMVHWGNMPSCVGAGWQFPGHSWSSECTTLLKKRCLPWNLMVQRCTRAP